MRRYLNAQERISLIWLHPHVLVMALLMVKIYLFTKTLTAALSAFKKVALSLCTQLDNALSQALAVPNHVSTISRLVLEAALASAENLTKHLFNLAIWAVKGLIGFAIDLYLGTVACLCTAFVRGTLEVLTEMLETVTKAVQTAVNATIRAFDSGLSGLSTLINGLVRSFDAVKTLFGGDSQASTILDGLSNLNMTVASLSQISIPTSYIDKIANLSNNVPDFENVLSNLTLLVTKPLDLMAYDVDNISFHIGWDQSGNSTKLETVQGSCHGLGRSFDVAISETWKLTHYILIAVGIACLLLLCVMAWVEYRKWNRHQLLLDELSVEHQQVRIGNMLNDYSHRLASRLVRKCHPKVRWWASYVATPALTKCLCLGIVGSAAVALQYCILMSIERKLKKVEVGNDNDNDISALARSRTLAFLNETQRLLNSLLQQANTFLFSSLTNTTATLYQQILESQAAVNNTIHAVFGSSPFAKPLQTIVYCTIGRKLEMVEEGLRWISNNVQIEFPLLPDTQIQQYSEETVRSLTNLSSDVSEEIHAALRSLISKYKEMLRIELITSCGFFALWILAVGVGFLLMLVKEEENPQSIAMITSPRPLSEIEREKYDLPFTDPFLLTCSSRYSET